MASSTDPAADPLRLLGDPYVAAVRDSLKSAASELRKEESSDVLVYVVGEANAGKSSIINALLGQELADVKPIAGWTKETTLYLFSDHLYVVDTPGLNEFDTAQLGEGVELDVRRQGDVILYVVNLAGNRTAHERTTYQEIRKLGRPTLLIANKVDVIDDSDRADVVSDIARRFGIAPSEVMAVSAKTNDGIEALSLKIFKILDEHGRGLLWAKNARHRDALVRNLVLSSAAAAAGVGLSPIPFSDVIPIAGVQSRMWIKIGRIYGYEVSREAAKSIIATVATGSAGRAIFRQAIKAVGALTGAGAVATSAVAATIAGSMTYGLGVAAQEYYRSGQSRTGDELVGLYKTAFEAFRKLQT